MYDREVRKVEEWRSVYDVKTGTTGDRTISRHEGRLRSMVEHVLAQWGQQVLCSSLALTKM